MALCLTPQIEAMTSAVTGRRRSLFANDLAANAPRIAALVTGRRVLVVGGAGSIGSATIRELVAFRPAALAVLDTSENNLAELVRTLRSSEPAFTGELAVQPLDYGSGLARAWLARQPAFDLVLSFAALKHVRSERDAFSLLRMLEVNLLSADRFLAACQELGHGRSGVFLVSTDKAAEPASLMGASKRAMELLLWSHGLPRATTTRFANVAFSDGSLPWGFLQRLAKRQPLAGPSDVRRYLVSPAEAGQLCLLAALCAPDRHVLIPALDPQRDAFGFDAVAAAVLAAHGLTPAPYTDDAAARAAVEREAALGRWPVVFSPSTTSGEKEMEIFVGPGEHDRDCGLARCRAIPAGPSDRAAFADFLALVAEGVGGGAVPDKAAITAALARVVPELHHRETGASLDGRM
jgi:nucleoside-diphosphate-sugar epimerase